MTATPPDLPLALRAIVCRFPRERDPNLQRLLACLERWARGENADEYRSAWEDLIARILTGPHWMWFLFPEASRTNADLLPVVLQLADPAAAPATLHDETAAARAHWVAGQGDLADAGSLISRLFIELLSSNPAAGHPFVFLSRYYTCMDLLVATFVEPALRPLHERVFALLYLQARNWAQPYCNGYLYQGWERLGLSGIKPTGERLAGYGIDRLLEGCARVLDVGANSGMLAVELAGRVAHVDAIELNPFLVEIGRHAAAHIGRTNVHFEVADVGSWQSDRRYDAVFSLANHCTIDGRMAMNFESYIAKLFALLEPGGWLFFESHNPFGPGTGGPGDDGDLDRKMEVAGCYFEVVATRMTRAFTPAHDIDKLFVAMRRRPAFDGQAQVDFSLEQARRSYTAGPLIRASSAGVPEGVCVPV